ncbi:MAG: YDG domain-containing protein [Janthinobacterium lividum]
MATGIALNVSATPYTGVGKQSAEMRADLGTLDPAAWTIYPGHTTPLLKSFLTPVTASFATSTVYNGAAQSLRDLLTLSGDPAAATSPNIFYSDSTTTGFKNAGTYAFTADLWSNQKGYLITGASLTGSLRIDKAPLALTPQALSKTYDGTTRSAGVVSATGLVGGDTLTNAVQGFDRADANTASDNQRTLSVGFDYVIRNNNEDVTDNYSVTRNTISTSQDPQVRIDPFEITVNARPFDKVYDGTPAAQAINQVVSTSDFSVRVVGAENYLSPNVGTQSIQVAPDLALLDLSNQPLANPDNFRLTLGSQASGVISPRIIRVEAVAANKVYDGTTSSVAPAVNGNQLAPGQQVVSATQSYASADAADGIDLNVGSIAISDANGVNVITNYSVLPFSAKGNITRRQTTIDADATFKTSADAEPGTKVYDGSTNAPGRPTASNLAPGQSVDATQFFQSADASDSAVLQVQDAFVYRDANANLVPATNYEVTAKNTSIGKILRRGLTIAARSASKTYDGTTDSAGADSRVVTPEISGLVAGEQVSASQHFDSRDAGERVLSVDAVEALAGTKLGNYLLTTVIAPGTITPRALDVAVGTASKTYDGNTSAGAPLVIGGLGLAPGDTLAAQTVFDSADAGQRKVQLAAGSAVADGNGGRNYSMTVQAGDGSITPALLSVIANNASKIYDGVPYSGGNGIELAGLVGADTAAVLDGQLAYQGSAQGAVDPGSFTITPSGLSARNYQLQNVDGILTIAAQGVVPNVPNTPVASLLALMDTSPAYLGGLANADNAANAVTDTKNRRLTRQMQASPTACVLDGSTSGAARTGSAGERCLGVAVVGGGIKLPPQLEATP